MRCRLSFSALSSSLLLLLSAISTMYDANVNNDDIDVISDQCALKSFMELIILETDNILQLQQYKFYYEYLHIICKFIYKTGAGFISD